MKVLLINFKQLLWQKKNLNLKLRNSLWLKKEQRIS